MSTTGELCELCGQPLPTIRVLDSTRFVVDLNIGMASNNGWAVGPVYAFRGDRVDAVAKQAAKYDSRHASTDPDDFGTRFVWAFEDAVRQADPIEIETITIDGHYVIARGAQGVTQKFEGEYWRALTILSDHVYIDRDPYRPAIFVRDDTIVGLVMGIKNWGDAQ